MASFLRNREKNGRRVLSPEMEFLMVDGPSEAGFEPGAVFEALGRAMAESHALEVALVRLYIVGDIQNLWPVTLHRLLAEREKWRIASRMQQVVLDLAFELPIAQRLALALQYRRYLVNDFAFEHERISYDPETHPAAIQRLQAIEAIQSEMVIMLNELFIERQQRRQDYGYDLKLEEGYEYYRGVRDSYAG